jgi:hypothetical protein
MSHPTPLTKVSFFFEEQLLHYADQWESTLLEGGLLEVENQVHQFASTVFDKLMTRLLTSSSSQCTVVLPHPNLFWDPFTPKTYPRWEGVTFR